VDVHETAAVAESPLGDEIGDEMLLLETRLTVRITCASDRSLYVVVETTSGHSRSAFTSRESEETLWVRRATRASFWAR